MGALLWFVSRVFKPQGCMLEMSEHGTVLRAEGVVTLVLGLKKLIMVAF